MLYNFQGLRFLFSCIILIPLVSFLLLIPRKFLCRVEIVAKKDTVTRGEPVELRVTVKNRGLLPPSRVLVKLRWKAPGEKETKVRHSLCSPGYREKISLELCAAHCGTAYLTMDKARIYDYFGLFSLSVGKKKRVEFCVVPVITPVSVCIPGFDFLRQQVMSGEGEGDLVLRDFQPGDGLHRVYWKLTAKGGALQVRDFERDDSLKVFLNFSPQLVREPEKWDAFLDRACSLMAYWAEEGGQAARGMLEIVWPQGEGFLKCVIPGAGAVEAWVCALLKGEAAGTVLLEDEIRCLSQGYHLEEDCELHFGEQCVYEEVGTFV